MQFSLSRPLLAGCMISLLLTGCSSAPDKTLSDVPVDRLYLSALDAVRTGRFKTAGDYFQEIDQKNPFSPWATRAQMNVIYTHFQQKEFNEAGSAAERFIRLHPRHPHVAYAFYMRAVSEFKQISTPMHDQEHTRAAVAALREVIIRFPETEYAEEARLMLAFCLDRLAAREISVGRYYLSRNEFIAASNRFRGILEQPDFRQTPYLEEALFSLVWSSYRLGLPGDARNYASVLGHNAPGSPFYRAALAILDGQGEPPVEQLAAMRTALDEGSLFRRFFEGLAPGIPGLTDRSSTLP